MKKKKIIRIIIITIIVVGMIIGIYSLIKYLENKKYNDKLSELITQNSWERDGGGDIEHIYFSEDGSYGYYCSCGNPVGNSDAYDSYVYDKETNTIKLINSYGGKGDIIKIKESTEYKLVLEIEGEERTFKSNNYHMLDNPLEFAGTKFESKDQRYNLVFEKDGSYEAYDSKKQEFSLYSGNCWTWTHKENSNKIILECNDETTKTIEIKEYNDTELKLYFESEKQTITFNKK